MRKSAVLMLCLAFCSCKSKQPNATSRTDGKGGGVTAQAAGGGKILGNDNPPSLFPVSIDGKYGYIDQKGKLVLKADYAGGSRFSEGLAAVQLRKAERVGFIDETGNLVIPLQFDLADPFADGFAAVMKNRKWGYIDRTGQIVIPTTFDAAAHFADGSAAVASIMPTTTAFFFINRKGETLLDAKEKFDMALPFGEGLAAVRTFGQMIRYIDQSGKTAIPPKYMAAAEFSQGLAPVQLHAPDGMRWGFIDKEGKMTITPHFITATPFKEGLAAVQVLGGKWGYINSKGSMIINPKFDGAGPFYNGMAQVFAGDAMGYINPSGKYVWEPK
jgi:hypothetical protein